MYQYYPCPRCGNYLTFLHQYGRWWCERCRAYPYDEPRLNPPSPTCLVCRNELIFTYQYHQWWCGTCRNYPYMHPDRKIERRQINEPEYKDTTFRNHDDDPPPLKLPLPTIDDDDSEKKPIDKVTPKVESSKREEEIRGPDGSVWFKVKDGKMRSTHQNPDSNFYSYDYELRGDNIYARPGNPYESTGKPIYRVRGGRAERIESSHREGDEHSSKFGIDKPKIKSARYESPFKKKRK